MSYTRSQWFARKYFNKVFHQFRQAKFANCGSILNSSQFLLLSQHPQKNGACFKSGQNGLKIKYPYLNSRNSLQTNNEFNQTQMQYFYKLFVSYFWTTNSSRTGSVQQWFSTSLNLLHTTKLFYKKLSLKNQNVTVDRTPRKKYMEHLFGVG